MIIPFVGKINKKNLDLQKALTACRAGLFGRRGYVKLTTMTMLSWP
jgi:hypothetical protein